MEFMGFQKCMDFLLGFGIVIAAFISDRYTQIASHMKNVLSHVTHYFDLWHLKKSMINNYSVGYCKHCNLCILWCLWFCDDHYKQQKDTSQLLAPSANFACSSGNWLSPPSLFFCKNVTLSCFVHVQCRIRFQPANLNKNNGRTEICRLLVLNVWTTFVTYYSVLSNNSFILLFSL